MPVREVVSKVHVEPPAPGKPTGRRPVIQALTNSAIAVTAFFVTCMLLKPVSYWQLFGAQIHSTQLGH